LPAWSATCGRPIRSLCDDAQRFLRRPALRGNRIRQSAQRFGPPQRDGDRIRGAERLTRRGPGCDVVIDQPLRTRCQSTGISFGTPLFTHLFLSAWRRPSSSATTGLVCGWQASWVLPKSGWCMLAAASVELSDLVWVTSPSIPEWPRIDDAVGRALSGGGRARVASPLRSGIGVCRGRLLFELEGDKPQQVVAAQAFSKPRNDADALPIANPTHTARPGSYRVHLRLGCQDNHHTAGRGSVWRSMVRPFSCCPVSCM